MLNRKGFTLIELLVVVAIIGLFATMSIIALNSARAKSRDAKRISDIKQIQTALELYFNENGDYPASISTSIASGTVFMSKVPSAPSPADGTCAANNTYTYNKATAGTYTLQYCLGAATGNLPLGTSTATPAGLR